MSENRYYKVIISDRARMLLASHIRFMAQVNKEAAKSKKKKKWWMLYFLLVNCHNVSLSLMNHISHQINITKC